MLTSTYLRKLKSSRRAAGRVAYIKPVPRDLCELQLVCAAATGTDFDRTFADYVIRVPQAPPDPYHYQHNPTGRRDIELTILQNDLEMSEMADDYRAHLAQQEQAKSKGLVTV